MLKFNVFSIVTIITQQLRSSLKKMQKIVSKPLLKAVEDKLFCDFT